MVDISFEKSRKGVAPVIAVALIILIVIVGVMNFDKLYSRVNSNLEAEIEVDSAKIFLEDVIRLERIFDDRLYVFSGVEEDVALLGVSVNSQKCAESLNLSYGYNEINISTCRASGAKKALVTLITRDGVFTDAVSYSDE